MEKSAPEEENKKAKAADAAFAGERRNLPGAGIGLYRSMRIIRERRRCAAA